MGQYGKQTGIQDLAVSDIAAYLGGALDQNGEMRI